ncbi:MAG: chemotaxis protein CheD [Candidatus Thermoplasmatota archaeon]|nr:chemotaxis protein CheD [Candidatus Thermoplasmatota archaeon]
MNQPHTVGIGQMTVCRAPEQIVCLGLGSCVAIILYDPVARIGGVAHVLLPKSPIKCDNEEKYADTGTRKLVKEMLNHGAKKERLVAKLVGGAQMFPNLNLAIANIGRENSMTVRNILREFKIRIVAEDLEGNRGRSTYFDTSDGHVTVKTAFEPVKVL